MTQITVTLSDEQMHQLERLAQQAKAPPEEWLSQPAQDFLNAAQYVLRKNQQLYQRLATHAG